MYTMDVYGYMLHIDKIKKHVLALPHLIMNLIKSPIIYLIVSTQKIIQHSDEANIVWSHLSSIFFYLCILGQTSFQFNFSHLLS